MADDQGTEGLDWEALRQFLLPPAVYRALGDVLGDEALAELASQIDRLREAGTPLLEGIRRAIAALGTPVPPGDVTVFASTATARGVAFDATVMTRTLTDTGGATDSIEITRGPDEFADLETYFQVALAFSFSFIYAWLVVRGLRGQAPTAELATAKDVLDWCAGAVRVAARCSEYG